MLISDQNSRWLKEKAVAEITSLSLSTLQKMRFRRDGIPYSKIGRAVVYSYDDVIAYMQAARINTQNY